MAAANRSRFAYVNFSDIKTLLDDGKLDAYDMIFAQDRNEYCIISPELEIKEVRGRVYTFESVSAANIAINSNKDTYPGMVVAIKSTEGKYEGYIVNESGNSFYVTAIKAGDLEIDYDNINNAPIKNIVAQEKIYLYDLPNGYYKVVGTYSINKADPTTRITNSCLALVRHDVGHTYIKVIDDNEIYDYDCMDEHNMEFTKYLTQKDIGQYNFMTSFEAYSTFVTPEQASTISAEVSKETISDTSADEQDIQDLFNKNEEDEE